MSTTYYPNCRCCPPQSGSGSGDGDASGSGSGSGSGGGGIDTACCPNLPTVLYLTFGGALAYLGTLPVTWNGSTGWAAAAGNWCENPDNPATVLVQCTGSGAWQIVWFVSGPPVVAPACFAPTTTACVPLLVTFSGCSGSCGGYTAVLTETPP